MNPMFGSFVSGLMLVASSTAFSTGTDPTQCGVGLQGNNNCAKESLANYANAGKKKLSYFEARTQMFQNVDAYQNGNQKMVDSVYSADSFEIGSSIPDDKTVNTEHTWPQSGLRKYPQIFDEARTDLFHLFPTTTKWNSLRGHLPFAEINGEPAGEKMSETNGQEFEPPEVHKGVVARAMFYMAIEYDMSIDAEQEKTLRAWAKQYPVTQKEQQRAAKVQQVQGNKNPFIDHPEWIDTVSDF